MSTFGGSTSRLASMGQRSNSRPDLSSSSYMRNDAFVSGNGFQGGDYQMADGGGYTYKTTYSRSSVHGGGGTGGRKMQVSMGAGGGGGGGGGVIR